MRSAELSERKPGSTRVRIIDGLRGIALLCMVFAHFLHVDTRKFDGQSILTVLRNANNLPEMFSLGLNIVASYMAPFLFLFLTGVMAQVKFQDRAKITLQKSLLRSYRLLMYAFFVNLIMMTHTYLTNSSQDVAIHWYSLFTPNILVVILITYWFNEWILGRMMNMYARPVKDKLILVLVMAGLLLISNIVVSDRYVLGESFVILISFYAGIFNSLLGSFFYQATGSFRAQVKWYFFPIGGILSVSTLIISHPTVESIKQYNLAYYIVCSLMVPFIQSFMSYVQNRYTDHHLYKALSSLGTYSLELYVVHFLVGYGVELLVLRPFLPESIWWINIVVVIATCYGWTVYVDHRRKRSL